MKYNLVKIRQNNKNGWETVFVTDQEDRQKTKTEPNKMGFYYYPDTMPPGKAFIKLKKSILDAHLNEIKRLQKSLEKLEALSYNA